MIRRYSITVNVSDHKQSGKIMTENELSKLKKMARLERLTIGEYVGKLIKRDIEKKEFLF